MELYWRPIATADTDGIGNVLLWNGERVFPGWYCDGDGWHDSRNPDHHDYPAEPQPSHWMAFPSPPSP